MAKTRSRRPFSSSLPLIILGLLVGGALAVIVGPFSQNPKPIPTAGPGPVVVSNRGATRALVTPGTFLPVPTNQISSTPTEAPATLEEALHQVIAKEEANLGESAGYSMVIHNLDTGEKFEDSSDKLFESASLYKLFVMLTVYYDISGGRLSLNDQITLIPDADASAEDGYTIVSPGNSLPVSALLERMIIDSNNTAGLMLLFEVRAPRMKDIVADLGFTSSDFSDTWNFQVTAQDLDLFFSRLADQKLLGPEYDKPMLDLLSRTQLRDRIPSLLPPDTHTANKTGDLDGVKNDAGIIYLPNGQRLLVSVLTHHVNDVAARQFIAELSLAAYNFYNKGQK